MFSRQDRVFSRKKQMSLNLADNTDRGSFFFWEMRGLVYNQTMISGPLFHVIPPNPTRPASKIIETSWADIFQIYL